MRSDASGLRRRRAAKSSRTTPSSAENFRWALTETYEYHATYLIKAYYDRRIYELEEESDSLQTCYYTGEVNEIFIHTTRDQEGGLINRFPLNYVSDKTDRLSIRYSLLVSQMALTPVAYEYWSILEDQSKQAGNLFELQPRAIEGNIHSLDDEEERVNGLFYATSIRKKRIKTVRPYIFTEPPSCERWYLVGRDFSEELRSYDRSEYPIYLLEVGPGQYDLADQECFDCRLRGGKLKIPSFWE